MTIRFYCNKVFDGWNAKDLETGIGGTEEKLIELARELAKKNDVTIYHNGEHGDFDGVHYRDYNEFKPFIHSDVFVSVKSMNVLKQSINADKILHWTTDIENWQGYAPQGLDKVIAISDWHKSRMSNMGGVKVIRSYIWADLERMDRNKVKKEPHTMLYASSFDRGLEDLLGRWGYIKDKLNIDKLYITYGWDAMDKVIKYNPNLQVWKKRMLQLMDQQGVEMVGRLTNDEMCKMYWKSEYWALPCNAPDNELFCINAVKAQYAGCIPFVRRVGGLQETVNEFIDFDALVGEKVGKDTFKDGSIKRNRQYVIDNFDMKKQIQEWEELMK